MLDCVTCLLMFEIGQCLNVTTVKHVCVAHLLIFLFAAIGSNHILSDTCRAVFLTLFFHPFFLHWSPSSAEEFFNWVKSSINNVEPGHLEKKYERGEHSHKDWKIKAGVLVSLCQSSVLGFQVWCNAKLMCFCYYYVYGRKVGARNRHLILSNPTAFSLILLHYNHAWWFYKNTTFNDWERNMQSCF